MSNQASYLKSAERNELDYPEVQLAIIDFVNNKV